MFIVTEYAALMCLAVGLPCLHVYMVPFWFLQIGLPFTQTLPWDQHQDLLIAFYNEHPALDHQSACLFFSDSAVFDKVLTAITFQLLEMSSITTPHQTISNICTRYFFQGKSVILKICIMKKKSNLEVPCKRNCFGYWNLCKRLPNFVNVAAIFCNDPSEARTRNPKIVLTLCNNGISHWLETVKSGWSILYIEWTQIIISNKKFFSED